MTIFCERRALHLCDTGAATGESGKGERKKYRIEINYSMAKRCVVTSDCANNKI